MPDDIAGRVHAILRRHNPRIPLSSDLALGVNGLHLDSIAMVQLMLECEEAFGVTLEPEVLTSAPLTVGSLIDALRTRVQE